MEWAKRVQISNVIALFCLKGKFLQPKTFTGVLFCDTEVPWKVWAKTESCFLNQPQKIGQFVLSRRKGFKFHILLLSFVWKVSCFNQKLSYEFYFLTLKSHEQFVQNMDFGFQFSPLKNEIIVFQETIDSIFWGLTSKPDLVFKALQCNKMKVQTKFLVLAIYLSAKRKQ